MKIYQHWAVARAQWVIAGVEKQISCYGGSNRSLDDAQQQAQAHLQKIEAKIVGDKHVFDDYEVAIREEIIQVVTENAIITRNRYGAQVLNVADMLILDIDKPKPSLWHLFSNPVGDVAADKAKTIQMIKSLAAKPVYRAYGLRIYETAKGIRVIVLGKSFDPRAPETLQMMRDFNCDKLYQLLCTKQGCFRARLTPKPHRLKIVRYPVKFPRDSQSDVHYQSWLRIYESASQDFSTCQFVEQVGAYQVVPDVVRLHDQLTGSHLARPLA